MILARDITRADGVLIAKKGAEITGSVIRVLERLAFEHVCVESGRAETPEAQINRLAKNEKEVEDRFVRVRKNPVLMKLKTALLEVLREDDVNGQG